mmetsp:Transcript_21240/g.44320  ORF Transcript_21240/g.44320 Transcript_21240/m.44320 type:complete len:450 (+) Transcript_21240:223-1572(+)
MRTVDVEMTEVPMGDESPSAQLHSPSFSSSSSAQEESFLPKGNKLFGCMGIFFLFSGGFIGSFFALDALEEAAKVNQLNAVLQPYPGKNLSNLEGIVTVDTTCSSTALANDNCKYEHSLSMSLTGAPGNITKVSLHDGIDCDAATNIGGELFKQRATNIYKNQDQTTPTFEVEIKEMMNSESGKEELRFRYLSGDLEFIPSLHIKSDDTCSPTGGSFGRDLEEIPAVEIANANASGEINFNYNSYAVGDYYLSYDITLSKSLNLTASHLEIYTEDPCSMAVSSALVSVALTKAPPPSIDTHYKGSSATITSHLLAPLRGTSHLALMSASGHALACAKVPASPYKNLNLTIDYGALFIDPGVSMDQVRGSAAVVMRGSEVLGCGTIPLGPYEEEGFSFKVVKIRENGTPVKRTTTNDVVQTGLELELYKDKLAIVENSENERIACGVLKG